MKETNITYPADLSAEVRGCLVEAGVSEKSDEVMVNSNGANNIICRKGEKWELCFEGEKITCTDSVGLFYIRELIENQGREVWMTDLVTARYGEPVEIMKEDELLESGVAVIESEDGITGETTPQVVTDEFEDIILPDKNRKFVIGLLDYEKGQLAVLQSKGLTHQVVEQKEYISKIEKYLRDHQFGSKNVCYETRTSHDRKSVAVAIRRAIKAIGKRHPSLANHLSAAIKTGKYCSYTPATELRWDV